VERVRLERHGVEQGRYGRVVHDRDQHLWPHHRGLEGLRDGTFQNANGDARADNIAWFDGTNWQPLGSNGAGNGPWVGEGSALEVVGRQLYAAGNFTSAGGDALAQSAASFHLAQIIAYPTPTVTPGPTAVPTPTVTPSPTPAPADTTAPKTLLRRTQINSAKRKATFRFASSTGRRSSSGSRSSGGRYSRA
jgi:hypothetical protein